MSDASDTRDEQFRRRIIELIEHGAEEGLDVTGAYVVPETDTHPRFQVEVTAVDSIH